jgi:predicted N-acetyltransferase YhbS
MLKNVVLREYSFWGRTSVVIIAGGYGFAMVSVMDKEKTVAILHDIIVHESWRQGGIGNKLLEAACEEAGKMGAEIVRLTVKPGSWMEGWYGRHGFDEIGVKVYDGYPCTVMEKDITRGDAVEPHHP